MTAAVIVATIVKQQLEHTLVFFITMAMKNLHMHALLNKTELNIAYK